MRYRTFVEIINQWGVTNLSRKFKFRVTTVQKWKDRNHIPPQYWKELLTFAHMDGVMLSGEDLIDAAAKNVPDKGAKKRR